MAAFETQCMDAQEPVGHSCHEELAALPEDDAAQRLAAEQEAERLDMELEDVSPKDWQRFYMDYHQRFVDDCVLELRDGRVRVALAQAPSAKVAAKRASEGRGPRQGRNGTAGRGQQQQLDKASDPALTGTTVWDGAVVLAHYLTETAVLVRKDGMPYACSGGSLPHVLELGAGTGAVSLALAACRSAASVTATDLPDLLPHLAANIARNGGVLPPGRVHVQALMWGPEGEQDVQRLAPISPPYDIIVGSDLIYYSYSPATPHSRLLLWTLRRLSGPSTAIYLSLSLHHNPEEVERFLGWAEEDFYVLRLGASVPGRWRVPDVVLVRLTRRKREAKGEMEGEGVGEDEGRGEGKHVGNEDVGTLEGHGVGDDNGDTGVKGLSTAAGSTSLLCFGSILRPTCS